ncbi:MAG: hypothetical protein CMP63_08560 [Flavobacteriales bacterium]|nr:hypothetical protein [Flavobacteriales bacterium]|tara:strand:- start:8783 stop:10513 length:1731 start_codon:yes stop_codon:yes gene_type:complete
MIKTLICNWVLLKIFRVLNNRIKKVISHLIPFLIINVTIVSCSENSANKRIGGNFNFCSKNRIHHLHPSLISDESTSLVASQIFEGLVKLNSKSLDVEPCLAKSYDFNPTTFVYSFKLRDNIYFHNNKCFKDGVGRKVTVDDVIYTFKNICTKQIVNGGYHNTLKGVVKGVEDYFNGESNDISGIRAINKSTIEIELHRPNGLFLKRLAGINFSIIAKEAVEKYGIENNVGTGPFIPLKFDSYNDQQVLIRNNKYYLKDKNGTQLPYLDSIFIDFEIGIKNQIQNVIDKKSSTVLNLPFRAVKRVFRDHKDKFDNEIMMQSAPFLCTNYIEFNLNSDVLKNKNIRKAISFALNKQVITDKVFGETRGKIGDSGITHPYIPNYRKNGVNGYSYNSDTAKKLIKTSGIDTIRPLQLDISEEDYKSLGIADEIRFQLEKELGIIIEINIVTERYKIEKSRYAKGDMYISKSIANFSSPEGFLNIFYGKTVPKSLNIPSFPNTTRFINKDFDRTLDRARRSIDEENANKSYAAAERLLMEECPIAVLWYEESNRLLNSDIRGFPLNQIQHIDLSQVYYSR